VRMTSRHAGFLLAAALCFFLGAALLPGLNADRRGAHLVMAPLDQSHPPELVLATTLLGGFRGLAVNAIGWRAWELKTQGKFWELVQLYDWISTLQPYLEDIWSDIAWNMAYNVVAEIDDPAQRWEWIWRAVKILRDKGLVYNPESHELPYQLAWIFWQKIGREIDEHYMEYMHFLALLIENRWYSGFLDLEDIAALPKTRDELRRSDPQVADLARRFEARGIDLFRSYDQLVLLLHQAPPGALKRLRVDATADLAKNEAIADWLSGLTRTDVSLEAKIDRARSVVRRLPDQLIKDFQSDEYADALRKVKLFRIARSIREEFRMDPARMLALEKKYAKMDWRLPEPHALYWASIALENRMKAMREGREKADTIDSRRLRVFCLQQLYRRGTLLFKSDRYIGLMRHGFNLDFLDAADRELEDFVQYYRRHPEERGAEGSGDAQKAFLQEAVRILYWAGLERKAQRFYRRLQRKYPSDDRARLSVDDWVAGQVRKMVKEWARKAQVENLMEGMLVRAYEHLVLGQTDMAVAYETQAREAWNFYRNDEQMRRQYKGAERNLPTWEELKAAVVQRILGGQYGELFPKAMIAKLRILLGAKEEKS